MIKEMRIKYSPLPAQRKFHRSPAKYRLYSGAFRAGKTKAGCQEAIKLSLKYPRNRGLIGRKDFPDLRDTTQRTFFQELKLYEDAYESTLGDISFGESEGIPGFRKNENIYRFHPLFGGSEILFRQLKEPEDYKSLELGWFYLDEGTETTKDMFLMLTSRLSLPHISRLCGFITTNPDTPSHWIHKLFIEKPTPDFEAMHTTSYDNPYLPEGYLNSLEGFYDDDYQGRYLMGKWGMMSGLVYKNFNRDVHVIKPFKIPASWERIRGIDFGYCYSEDTEVLTSRGWLTHDKITLDDKIACFDTASNSLRWDTPLGTWSQYYAGKMIEVDSRSTNFFVSPEHSLWVSKTKTLSNGKNIRQDYEKIKAKELLSLKNNRFRVKLAAPIHQSGHTTYSAPEYYSKRKDRSKTNFNIPINLWLRFLGWFISEGSAAMEVGRWGIYLTQRLGDYSKEIDELFKALPYTYHRREYVTQWGKKQVTWQIHCKALWTWLRENCGTCSQNKKVPDFIFDCSIEQRKIFLETMIKGDGSFRKKEKRSPVYWSSSTQLLDQLQAIALSVGYGSTKSIYPWGMGKISILPRDEILLERDRHVKERDYEGNIYCLITKTGYYVTRRKNKPAIQGNTNPFVCLWLAFDQDDRVYIYDEHYRPEMNIDDHARIILEKTGEDHITGTYADPSAAQERADLERFGVSNEPADNTTQAKTQLETVGIQNIQRRLKLQGDGKPLLYVFDLCVKTIKEFELYKWRVSDGEVNENESPLKLNDHTSDAARYCLNAHDRGLKMIIDSVEF